MVLHYKNSKFDDKYNQHGEDRANNQYIELCNKGKSFRMVQDFKVNLLEHHFHGNHINLPRNVESMIYFDVILSLKQAYAKY